MTDRELMVEIRSTLESLKTEVVLLAQVVRNRSDLDLSRSDQIRSDQIRSDLDKDPAPPKQKVGPTWDAYVKAYTTRYGTGPVRNATVNGQLCNLVKRLGDEAPAVAAFYVESEDFFYVKNGHSVGILVKDAEKLRTEWATRKTNKPVVMTFEQRAAQQAKAKADAAAERRKAETQSLLEKQKGTPAERLSADDARKQLADMIKRIG